MRVRFVSGGAAALLAAAALLFPLRGLGAADTGAPVVVDAFDDVSAWSAHPADGVKLGIGSGAGYDGNAMRLDFEFLGGGGYAVAHRKVDLNLPANYVFTFRVRGEPPPENLEFKLIDSSGENVWWFVRRDFTFPKEWMTLKTRKRQIRFAWGPAGGGEIHHVAALEIVVTAGSGGKGTVWVDDLRLRELPPPDPNPPAPKASASSEAHGHRARSAADGDSTTYWASESSDRTPGLTLDLGEWREFGGLVVDWLPGRAPADYVVEAPNEDGKWQPLATVDSSDGGRDYLYLPDSESDRVRIRAVGGVPADGVAVSEVALEPIAFSASREAFFETIAAQAPRGAYPRGFSGEQVYWTVVGQNADRREVLVNEDGAVGSGIGSFSVEPFVFTGGKLTTWAGVDEAQDLEMGSLPIPSVRRRIGDLLMETTCFASGDTGASSVVGRYRLQNRGSGRIAGTLYLAIRPFQVNPPSQTLNNPGGCARVRSIARDGRVVRVNGDREVVSLTAPGGFGAATFYEGDVVADYLSRGRLPSRTAVSDTFEAASAALAYDFDLGPGSAREVDVVIPLYPDSPVPPEGDDGQGARWTRLEFNAARGNWAAATGRTTVKLADPASPVVSTLRAQLGYILVNRAGPAIRPGARAYRRSWIRDGSLTSTALLRLQHADAAHDFVTWFAAHQYPNGKIPCVVDDRGADPVPEHDSSGEFIYLVAEVERYTGDRAFAESLYPRVLSAVAYLDSLRHVDMTPEYREGEKQAFYGILPPSISHEGYSAKPMHSYWDDFWALRGFEDAAYLAGVLGHSEDRARLEGIRAEFQKDLLASIAAAVKQHGIDYIPGCADLGDFDATSTTIALAPVDALDVLPREAVDATFEKYWKFFTDRRAGAAWDAFTPYEIRNVGAFVRLGWRERAGELLDWFLEYQRPEGWRQWAEVVGHDERKPRFIGDMPHTWVGSDYIRSVLDMLAYERGADSTLVLGAGVQPAWIEGSGILVKDLETPFGTLSYLMKHDGNEVTVQIDKGLRVPPGGIVVAPPVPAGAATAGAAPGAAAGACKEAYVNAAATPLSPEGRVTVRAVPATVQFRY
jgi:hypothetical protein